MSTPMDTYYSSKINISQKEYDNEKKAKLNDIEKSYKNQYEKIINAKNVKDSDFSNKEKTYKDKTNILKSNAFVMGKILKKRIGTIDSLHGVNNSGLTKRSNEKSDFTTNKKVLDYNNQLKSDIQTTNEQKNKNQKDAFDKLNSLNLETNRKKQKVEDDYKLKLQKLYNQIELTKRQYNAKELEKKLKS